MQDSQLTGRPAVGRVKVPLSRIPADGRMTAWLPLQVRLLTCWQLPHLNALIPTVILHLPICLCCCTARALYAPAASPASATIDLACCCCCCIPTSYSHRLGCLKGEPRSYHAFQVRHAGCRANEEGPKRKGSSTCSWSTRPTRMMKLMWATERLRLMLASSRARASLTSSLQLVRQLTASTPFMIVLADPKQLHRCADSLSSMGVAYTEHAQAVCGKCLHNP